MIATEFTRQFGVPHPILCGGMTGYGTAPLIGAVANAGALGFLTALTQPTRHDPRRGGADHRLAASVVPVLSPDPRRGPTRAS
ncbi:hypothetical protein [Nocardioides immobilis]|uniref:hypothetical protein n=1 Tax=Nocardioides immobilis TaxID=2049295 RepID=UPI001FE2DFCF|nr:hypothetical protein [Nocardioides immobilis]